MFRWSKHYLLGFIKSHIIDYPTPINLSYMWSFGFTAGICLVTQLLTGIFLAMHYIPDADAAFSSVEHIMREVNNGWFVRYTHANGASMFFIVVYSHIFRGLYYTSYATPKSILWVSGIFIFLLMIATAFLGYVLPWGQMSFWGATVITNLFSAIPYAGDSIVEWLWGGYSVDSPTLTRFFSLHYLFPFLIAGLVIVHLSLLHRDGSSNPTGITQKVDNIAFYPYFSNKDTFSIIIFFIFFAFFVFFYPNALGHPDNYIEANPLLTPAHIVPEWYFLPFYAILRTMPTKISGVLTMFGAIVVLIVLPWIDKASYQSAKSKPIHFFLFWCLFFDFILLGWIGQQPVEPPYTAIGSCATVYYFIHFLVLLPLTSSLEAVNPNNSIKDNCTKLSLEKYNKSICRLRLKVFPLLLDISTSVTIFL